MVPLYTARRSRYEPRRIAVPAVIVASCRPRVGSRPARPVRRARSPRPGPAGSRSRAVLLGALLAALVWHATKLDRVDAWAYRWQEVANQHGGRVAEVVSGTEAPVVLLTMLACAFVAWRAGRRDAVLLAVARRTGHPRRRVAAETTRAPPMAR